MGVRQVVRAVRGELPPVPLSGASDARWSVIGSAEDMDIKPNTELVNILLTASERAKAISLADLQSRSMAEHAAWVGRWPGEHYRLLAALTEVLKPAFVVEVGTYKGHGTLALSAGCRSTRVTTYDVIAWTEFGDTALREADFIGGKIEQRIGDLGDAAYLDAQLATLQSADVIFIDGPKDGEWEQRALGPILRQLADRQRLVVLDDIRLLEMVQLWRDLPFTKLDATSLGHWSGTGLIHTL